ncbi:MAG: hypothetical protein EHM83_15760 [Burkholderiales bacterium]|nr:MAG: hypothetical protein EHM83_15760 [Burkholderiales bacterium]
MPLPSIGGTVRATHLSWTDGRTMRGLQLIGACLLATTLTSMTAGTPANAAGATHALERPASHDALLQASARQGFVVVALFTLPGCPFCETIRREQLRHLAREQAERGVRVVEYDLTDHKPFAGTRTGADPPDAQPASHATPAALAAALGIRLAPTVVFLGPDGRELAERLVGYQSSDFYGAYLDQRIAQARSRLAERTAHR